MEDLGSPMAVVANWADHVRHFLPWSGSLHYVDVRDDLIEGGCHYHYNNSTMTDNSSDASSSSDLCEFQYYHRDCTDGGCVVGAILNYSTQLIERPQQQKDYELDSQMQSNDMGASTSLSSSSSLSSLRYLRQRTTTTTKEENDRNQHSPTVYDSSSSSSPNSVRQALMFLIQ